MDAALAAALVAAGSSLVASVAALVTAANVARTAKRLRGAADMKLDRITHQLGALDQAWYWTPEWQAGEEEATEDLAAGRFVRFHSTEEMDAHLASVAGPGEAISRSGRHS
jgi:hypothetical protein